MNTDQADPRDLEAIREALNIDDGGESARGWDAVHAFEAEHGIVVPEPYRTFVAEISDGSFTGPPDFGLVGLAQTPADWGSGRPERCLAQPFPLTRMWIWEDDPQSDEEIGPLIEKVTDHGSIVLGTDGCGMYWHLIVTGEHRGHIWNINGEGAMPFGAEFGYTTGESGFAGWVKHWASGADWFDTED
jgi:hypothetical protein